MRGGDALTEEVLLRQLDKLFRRLKIVGLKGGGKIDGCLVEKAGGLPIQHDNHAAFWSGRVGVDAQLLHGTPIQ